MAVTKFTTCLKATATKRQFTPVTSGKIPEQMNQSEDGPFSMFSLTKLNVSSRRSLPLQSHLTRKVLLSAHRNPFTADKLKWAKSSISAFLDRI